MKPMLTSFARYRSFLPAVFLASMLTSRASACLNDTAIQSAEEEYRSRYDAPAPDPLKESTSPPLASYAALAVGGGLVAGTMVTSVKRRKRVE